MPVTSAIRSVGLGELCVAVQSDDLLVAQALGSCIGIAAYDPARRIALMAHVMLPGPAPERGAEQPARYAAQAVQAIVNTVQAHGGIPRNLVVKLAGGAQVIAIPGMEDRLKIGARNIEAVHAALTQHGLRIRTEDVGGRVGRTLTLYASSGKTTIRVVGGVEQEL